MSTYPLRIDVPFEEWPPVEQSALVIVVGDRQRPGARKLLRRFLGRAGLQRVLRELRGRWILIACGHVGVTATEAGSVGELIEAHRDVLAFSRLVNGHVEVFHALDAETRAAVIIDSREHALRIAPVAGSA